MTVVVFECVYRGKPNGSLSPASSPIHEIETQSGIVGAKHHARLT